MSNYDFFGVDEDDGNIFWDYWYWFFGTWDQLTLAAFNTTDPKEVSYMVLWYIFLVFVGYAVWKYTDIGNGDHTGETNAGNDNRHNIYTREVSRTKYEPLPRIRPGMSLPRRISSDDNFNLRFTKKRRVENQPYVEKLRYDDGITSSIASYNRAPWRRAGLQPGRGFLSLDTAHTTQADAPTPIASLWSFPDDSLDSITSKSNTPIRSPPGFLDHLRFDAFNQNNKVNLASSTSTLRHLSPQNIHIKTPVPNGHVETAVQNGNDNGHNKTPVQNAQVETPLQNRQVETPVQNCNENGHIKTPLQNGHVETPVQNRQVETPVQNCNDNAHIKTPVQNGQVETPMQNREVETPVQNGNENAHIKTPVQNGQVETPMQNDHVETPMQNGQVETPVKNGHVKNLAQNSQVETPVRGIMDLERGTPAPKGAMSFLQDI